MKILILTILFLAFCLTADAQTAADDTVCISQSAANRCAENTRELEATRGKIAVLEAALLEKDKNEADLKEVARKNQMDLIERIQKTEVELSRITGQLIEAQANGVSQRSIIQFLLQNTKRRSKFGIVNF